MLSVKGVDMVQFGPADYSMSIGIPGQWDHPRVKEAEVQVIKTALRLGVAPRVAIDTPEQARPYLEMGVRHFCMGWDVGIRGRGGHARARRPGRARADRALARRQADTANGPPFLAWSFPPALALAEVTRATLYFTV